MNRRDFEFEIEKLQDKIKTLENNVEEIKKQSERNIEIYYKLIYLIQTKFIGSLKNKNLIAELKNRTFCPDKGIVPVTWFRDYDDVVRLIKSGDVEYVELLYNAIKHYEKIEENIKKYGGTKK